MISAEDNVEMSSEDSSSPYSYDGGGGEELELGLGLSIGGSRMLRRRDGDHGEITRGNSTKKEAQFLYARILTAKDFPSCVFRSAATSSSSAAAAACSSSSTTSSSSSTLSRVGGGTKRSADSPAGGASAGQVVGWPPVRAYRMNSMVHQARSVATEDYNSMAKKNQSNERVVDNVENRSNMNPKARSSLFVKVNMDGTPIGRKVDLSSLGTYEALARTLEDMFFKQSPVNGSSTTERNTGRRLNLLDGSSGFVITYEDKDGDWMLVGDVPWGMFINSVKRLKIMRTTDATGLGNKDEIR